MPSDIALRAIDTALSIGKAVIKFITSNETGRTGSNQTGYYLPKEHIDLFSPHTTTIGQTLDSHPTVIWHDGRETHSRVVWYGNKKKRGFPNPELRLTRFGRNFPWLRDSLVGSVLCLVPENLERFHAFVLETDDDIQAIQTGIAIEIRGRFGVYREHRESADTENNRIENYFSNFANNLTQFPSGQEFSQTTWEALETCLPNFRSLTIDNLLMRCIDAEYRLFRLVEKLLYESRMREGFTSFDTFLTLAKEVINRRASRAGRSLENHVAFIFTREGITYIQRVRGVQGTPDILIPSREAYESAEQRSTHRVFAIGIKTTCRDRWRQVISEAPLLDQKYIITLQPTISVAQIDEMIGQNIKLVVPTELKKNYPISRRAEILCLSEFTNRILNSIQ